MTPNMTSPEYELRKAIQQVREQEGLGAVRMWHEPQAVFDAFMLVEALRMDIGNHATWLGPSK